MRWLRRLLARLFGARKRVTGAEPRTDTACWWCGEVKRTTKEEVWSEAIPEGYLVRICKECGEACARG